MLAKSVINAKNDEDRQNLVHGMIGELTDIIAGSASSAIKQVTIEISPTVVIIGENH